MERTAKLARNGLIKISPQRFTKHPSKQDPSDQPTDDAVDTVHYTLFLNLRITDKTIILLLDP